MNQNKWTIVNNAAIGRSYGSFDTRQEAIEAARRRNEFKRILIDDESRIVYFREEVKGF